MCGIVFLGGPSALYCPTCRVDRGKERDAEHRRRKRLGLAKKVGDPLTCIGCGAVYSYYTGCSTDRCHDCCVIYGKEIDKINSKKWNKENKEKYQQAKEEYNDRKKERMNKIEPQPTGEKYITKRKDSGRYRVQIGRAYNKHFDNLQDAIKARDAFLQSKTEIND